MGPERNAENQLMFYKALHPATGNMWDTWLYLHQGTYYLYYLARSGEYWDNISMARSADAVHWEELGPILRKRDSVTWMGTGSTWAAPGPRAGDRFLMNFSEWEGSRQTIFFAESDDLEHWRRLEPSCEFIQDTRWYEEQGRWDCIYTIPRPGGGLYGYWTADPLRGPGVGFGQSDDGVAWEAQPPPPFAEGAPHGEVGAVEKIGERYYLMIGEGGGMRTLIAAAPEGPFAPAATNFDLLAGQSFGHTYFARFLPISGAVLVNHHSIRRDGAVYCAPLKRAVVDAAGTLRLGWWEGNEVLKREAVLIPGPLGVRLDTTAGIIVEGLVTLPTDGHPTGLRLGTADGNELRILVDSDGVTRIGPATPGAAEMTVEETTDRAMSFPPQCRFRLLAKHTLLEFYLHGTLMQGYSAVARYDGSLGVLGEVSDLQVWQLPAAQGLTGPAS